MAAPGPSRFDAHRSDRREQLLDAATETVRRFGVATTMEAVAAEVGVAKPVLYRYFGDRAGLFDALAARFGSRLAEAVSAALARESSPKAVVAGAIDAYVGVLESEPEVYRFVTTRVRADRAKVEGVLGEATRMVTELLERGLLAAGRDAGPAAVWAGGIVGMVHVATDRWLADPVVPRSVLVEQLSDLLWSGMRAGGAAGTPIVLTEVEG